MNKTNITLTIDKDVYLWVKLQSEVQPSMLLNTILKSMMDDVVRPSTDEQAMLDEIAFHTTQIGKHREARAILQTKLSSLQSEREVAHAERLARGRAMVDAIRFSGGKK
jgi:hypothetical protein